MIEFSATMILAHLWGDFVCQPDWQARGKRDSSYVAAAHALTYTLVVGSFLAAPAARDWLLGLSWAFPEPGLVLAVKLGLVFLTHFLLDRYGLARRWMNLRWVGQSRFAEDLKPWSIIIVDNTLHLWVLWVLWMPRYPSV